MRPYARRGMRRGVALMTVLVCLLVIATLGGAILHTMLAAERDLRLERDRLQVFFLLESGIERAEYALAADEQYNGEQWKIGAEELDNHRGAVVKIVVKPDDRDPLMRYVTIEVTLGDGPHRVSNRVTRLVRFTSPEETP